MRLEKLRLCFLSCNSDSLNTGMEVGCGAGYSIACGQGRVAALLVTLKHSLVVFLD